MATKYISDGAFEPKHRLAFIIGINNYEEWPRLKNPINDARVLSSALQRIGFQTTEAIGTKVSRTDIKHMLLDFVEKIDSGDIVLFYFAGHGIQWEVCFHFFLFKLLF